MNKIAFYICFHLIPYNLSLLSFPCVFYFYFQSGGGGRGPVPALCTFFLLLWEANSIEESDLVANLKERHGIKQHSQNIRRYLALRLHQFSRNEKNFLIFGSDNLNTKYSSAVLKLFEHNFVFITEINDLSMNDQRAGRPSVSWARAK